MIIQIDALIAAIAKLKKKGSDFTNAAFAVSLKTPSIYLQER